MSFREPTTSARAIASTADMAKRALRAAGALLGRRLLGAAVGAGSAKSARAAVLPSCAVAVIAKSHAVRNREAAVVAVWFDV